MKVPFPPIPREARPRHLKTTGPDEKLENGQCASALALALVRRPPDVATTVYSTCAIFRLRCLDRELLEVLHGVVSATSVVSPDREDCDSSTNGLKVGRV